MDKLCVAVCPIGSDGYFNFSACCTHNYREFMGGFADCNHCRPPQCRRLQGKHDPPGIAIDVAEPVFRRELQDGILPGGVPAGEDVIRPLLDHRKEFLDGVVRALQEKKETVYLLADSDAEAYVATALPAQAHQASAQRTALRPSPASSPECR
ncbi:MAG TPA: hypothetical protein VEI01_06715 [Terriglobales bacterium]|nr:hypothetical protein [Terriglobales bacterium]